MGPLLPGDGRRDQAEGLARTRRAVRDGPDDSRSRLTEVGLGQLAPFIDDYKAALGVYALPALRRWVNYEKKN